MGIRDSLHLEPRLATDQLPVWIVVPSPFASEGASTRGSIVIRIEARTPLVDDPQHRAALAICLDDLREQGDAALHAIRQLGDAAALARPPAAHRGS